LRIKANRSLLNKDVEILFVGVFVSLLVRNSGEFFITVRLLSFKMKFSKSSFSISSSSKIHCVSSDVSRRSSTQGTAEKSHIAVTSPIALAKLLIKDSVQASRSS
jgi:hypothetical protein